MENALYKYLFIIIIIIIIASTMLIKLKYYMEDRFGVNIVVSSSY